MLAAALQLNPHAMRAAQAVQALQTGRVVVVTAASGDLDSVLAELESQKCSTLVGGKPPSPLPIACANPASTTCTALHNSAQHSNLVHGAAASVRGHACPCPSSPCDCPCMKCRLGLSSRCWRSLAMLSAVGVRRLVLWWYREAMMWQLRGVL
jgi:hypothetical protein